MRISDLMISNNYLRNLNRNKSRLEEIQSQLSTMKKINRPSDSPAAATKILRLNTQIGQSDLFAKNISNSLSFIQETTFGMENIQDEITKIMSTLTEIGNTTNQENLDLFADQIDLAIKAILDAANSNYDGKYVFGGTDYSTTPFGFTADGTAIEIKPGDISGKQNVKVGHNIFQKINITGTELFGTIVKQAGNLDVNAAVGSVTTNQLSVYDAQGQQYTLTLNYTKTAANTYDLSYDITDSGGTSVYTTAPAPKQIVFNSSTGRIESIDGDEPSSFNITVPGRNINFNFDPLSLKETNAAASISMSANQDVDIFNTLIMIRDNLRNGVVPTSVEEERVKSFNRHLLNKMSELGNVTNQLYSAEELLGSQKLILEGLKSKEQDVDVAKAIMDLQTQDYLLQVSYKLSATVLPKSLLDYL
ncbi:MAG: flagellar hook-associated protein FlgL [Ignavibacteriales bacterium]|nr:MAG: flagellar hook-associated protein FlgL [Ignavibacteriales bacterium]